MYIAAKMWGVLLTTLVITSNAWSAEVERTYPTMPIRMIVAFSPGGSTDIVARVTARHLSNAFGRQVVVDNRPGAGGNIGVTLAAQAQPDGYTLLVAFPGLTVNPSLYSKLEYDPLKSFVPISLVGTVPSIFVVPVTSTTKSVEDLLALARTTGGKINYGSAGTGTTSHLAGELFKTVAKIDAVHVPYKGDTPALVDLMAGNLDVMIAPLPAALGYVNSGRLRILAIASAKRSNLIKNIPTMAEAGFPGYEAGSWYGVVAPAGTSAAIVDRLSTEIARGMKLPEIRDNLTNQGVEVIGSMPTEFGSFLKKEVQLWSKVVRDAGIRVE
jgi:tripartite-type tricarboxylate transporter receptor subunit TctC